MVEISTKTEFKGNLAIIKEATILHDGRQFVVKIPKEISDFYSIKKKDKFKFIVNPIDKKKGVNSFEILK